MEGEFIFGEEYTNVYCALSTGQALSWVSSHLIFTAILQTINISILYLRKLRLREVKSQSSILGRTSIKAKFET